MMHIWVLLVGIASFAATGDETHPQFRVTTRRNTDHVEVKVKTAQVVFSIHSLAGIGEAVIERIDEKWPETVLLQLHLKGLESFQISNGKVTLNAAVSSHADDKQQVRLWQDDKENSPLDSKSQFWMEIQMFDGDGKPAKNIPLKDGYFEIQLPKAFFEGNPKSITVNWIDFYRN